MFYVFVLCKQWAIALRCVFLMARRINACQAPKNAYINLSLTLFLCVFSVSVKKAKGSYVAHSSRRRRRENIK